MLTKNCDNDGGSSGSRTVERTKTHDDLAIIVDKLLHTRSKVLDTKLKRILILDTVIALTYT